MKGISVTKTNCVETCAVVIDGRRAINHFVKSVAIDISDAEGVRSLTYVIRIDVAINVAASFEVPAESEIAVAIVIRGNLIPGLATTTLRPVITACHDQAGALAIEIRDSRGKAVDPITVIVTPLRD
jgi:hypothetical protein